MTSDNSPLQRSRVNAHKLDERGAEDCCNLDEDRARSRRSTSFGVSWRP